MKLQFLESLDSVRVARTDGPLDADARLSQLQTFLEVVMTLALGRTVVVPHSFAFDSDAFLVVAQRVLGARQAAVPESTDRPFRVHLHGFDNFEAAIAAMIERAHLADDPFISSAYPELVARTPEARAAMPRDVESLLRVTDDAVAARLDVVRTEFRRMGPIMTTPRTGGLSLPAAVHQLTDPDSPMSAQRPADDGELQDAYDALVAAVRTLQPAGFSQRSLLRRPDLPWPTDPEGHILGQLVDEDALVLVRGFVDTLYNRVVFDSVGTGSATFSTAATRGGKASRARVLAQRLALGLPISPGGTSPAEELPLFNVLSQPAVLHQESALIRVAESLFEGGSTALHPLLSARAEDRSKSPFWASVQRLDSVAAQGDRKAFQKALDAHVAIVEKLLPQPVRLSLLRRGEVTAGLSIAGATSPNVADLMLQLPDGWVLGLTFIGAAVPFAVQGVGRMTEWRARKSVSEALGDYMRGDANL